LWPDLLLCPIRVTSESSTFKESVSLVSASSLCSVSWKDERNRSHLFDKAITWWFGISTNNDSTFNLAILTVLTTGHKTNIVTTKVPNDARNKVKIS